MSEYDNLKAQADKIKAKEQQELIACKNAIEELKKSLDIAEAELSELRKAGELLEQDLNRTIEQRDNAQEFADALADKISCASGYSIGEHSSANNPWQNALDIELPQNIEE